MASFTICDDPMHSRGKPEPALYRVSLYARNESEIRTIRTLDSCAEHVPFAVGTLLQDSTGIRFRTLVSKEYTPVLEKQRGGNKNLDLIRFAYIQVHRFGKDDTE